MPNELGIWIREVRLSRGFTQAELAKRLGFASSQAVANIERGAASFPVTRAKRFSKVTDTKIEDLITQLVQAYEASLRRRLDRTRA